MALNQEVYKITLNAINNYELALKGLAGFVPWGHNAFYSYDWHSLLKRYSHKWESFILNTWLYNQNGFFANHVVQTDEWRYDWGGWVGSGDEPSLIFDDRDIASSLEKYFIDYKYNYTFRTYKLDLIYVGVLAYTQHKHKYFSTREKVNAWIASVENEAMYDDDGELIKKYITIEVLN